MEGKSISDEQKAINQQRRERLRRAQAEGNVPEIVCIELDPLAPKERVTLQAWLDEHAADKRAAPYRERASVPIGWPSNHR